MWRGKAVSPRHGGQKCGKPSRFDQQNAQDLPDSKAYKLLVDGTEERTKG